MRGDSMLSGACTHGSTGHRRDAMKRKAFGGVITTSIETMEAEKVDIMNRVTHFEIYTDDPVAVQPFYKDVFGWKFQKFEGGPIEYWLVTTGDDKEPGINGGMT